MTTKLSPDDIRRIEKLLNDGSSPVRRDLVDDELDNRAYVGPGGEVKLYNPNILGKYGAEERKRLLALFLDKSVALLGMCADGYEFRSLTGALALLIEKVRIEDGVDALNSTPIQAEEIQHAILTDKDRRERVAGIVEVLSSVGVLPPGEKLQSVGESGRTETKSMDASQTNGSTVSVFDPRHH